MLRLSRQLLVVVLLALFVSPVYASLASGGSVTATQKISPKLLEASSIPQRVIVTAKGGIDAVTASMHMTYTLGGSDSYVAFGTATQQQLLQLANMPGVVQVAPDVPLNYNDSKVDSTGQGLIQTDMFRIRSILGTDKVNSVLNITGKGVNVAIVDTGTDFGNPELTSAVARDNQGNPIALDTDGMGIVLTNTTANRYVNASGVYLNLLKGGRGTVVPVYMGFVGYPTIVARFNWTLADFKIGTDASHYIVSQSQVYHFGLAFEQTPYGYALFPSLVVDSNAPGLYDTVYMDFRSAPRLTQVTVNPGFDFNTTADWSFLNDKPHHVGDGSEALSASFSGGPIPDISAGLLGGRVLDVFGVITNTKSAYDFDLGALSGSLLAPIDPNGGYFGVMYDFEGHGTQTASNVASQGLFSYNIYGNGSTYKLEGVAPGAKILAVKALLVGDILYGWMWASGFDYNAATHQWVYSGNHRAPIISNSWGMSDWPIFVSGMGYDTITVLEDALSVPGTFASNYPGTLIVQAMGNGGPGYGTVTSPAASSYGLSIGASTSWHVAQQFSAAGAPYYGGSSSYYDDVISWSDRGPSPVAADAKPDLVNVGAFGFTPTSILEAGGNGSNAWNYFGGTSQATPLTAGVAALVEQALLSRGGSINPLTVKAILMSTAQDTGNDPFVQGAGRVNALAAVSYALGGSSLVSSVFSVSTNSTYANVLKSFQGAEEALSRVIGMNATIPTTPQPDESWFAGYLRAGSSSTATFTVSNPTASSLPLNITSTTFQQIKEVSFSNVSIPGSSVFINLTKATGPIPNSADMMIVNEVFPFSSWMNSNLTQYYANDITRLRLQVFNWNDQNHNGIPDQNETALINTGYAWGNGEQARVTSPTMKFSGTPLLGVYQNPNYDSYWYGVTNQSALPVHFTISVYYLKKVTWSWVSPSTGSLTLAPKSATTFGATLSVPPTANPGIYEGYITLKGGNGQETQIPTTVTIPIDAAQKGVPYVFGGVSDSNGLLYDNGATFGAVDFSWRYESGNWRYYKLNISDTTVNQGSVTLNWTYPQTSINLLVMDPQGRIIASSVPPGLYKTLGRESFFILPYLIPSASNDYLGAPTSNPLGWAGGFAPSQNSGNTSSALQFPVNETGLYTIVVHNTLFSGNTPSENFTGVVELNTVLPIQSAPTITATPPAGLATGSIAIPIAISGSQITRVSYSVDSFPLVSIPSTAQSLSIDTAKLSDGSHSVTVWAWDVVGHVATYTFTFSSLNSAPLVSIENPQSGITTNGIVNIAYTVQGASMTGVTMSIDGNAVQLNSGSSYLWNSTQANDGTHTLTLTASNAVGKTSTVSVTFSTNNQAFGQQKAQQLAQQRSQLNTLNSTISQQSSRIDSLNSKVNLLTSEVLYSVAGLVGAVVVAAILAVRRRR